MQDPLPSAIAAAASAERCTSVISRTSRPVPMSARKRSSRITTGARSGRERLIDAWTVSDASAKGPAATSCSRGEVHGGRRFDDGAGELLPLLNASITVRSASRSITFESRTEELYFEGQIIRECECKNAVGRMESDLLDGGPFGTGEEVDRIATRPRERVVEEDYREGRGAADEQGSGPVGERDDQLIPVLRERSTENGPTERILKIPGHEGQCMV